MLSLGFHIAMGTGSSNRTQRLPGTESLVFPILSDQNVTEEHRRRRRLQAMEGGLEGNTMPLGYFYTRLHVGTPGQVFTVIVDTGSSLLAFPCEGCQRCGTHMDSYFRPLDSTTFKPGSCKNIKDCQACDKGVWFLLLDIANGKVDTVRTQDDACIEHISSRGAASLASLRQIKLALSPPELLSPNLHRKHYSDANKQKLVYSRRSWQME
jgi:hypothetical protein